MATKTLILPFFAGRLASNAILPSLPSSGGLYLIGSVLSTEDWSTQGAVTDEARFEVTLPGRYQAGTNGSLRATVAMQRDSASCAAAIDMELLRIGNSDNSYGDVVTTAAQTVSAHPTGEAPWPYYEFAFDGSDLQPGDRLLLKLKIALTSDGYNVFAEVGQLEMDYEDQDMNADDLANINVDSTGGQLTLAKALEVIAARCVGNLAYDGDSGEVTFYGRDGQTPVASVKLTGGGNRTQSEIP
jgi:hypothetical protein